MLDGPIRPRGKTALVLAGGGLSGAVYEIGALRAIDDLLIDRTVNDFDIFVGTSAGAIIASFVANGLSPQAMWEVFEGSHASIRAIEPDDLFHINRGALGHWLAGIPNKLWKISKYYSKHRSELNLFDLGWNLAATLPPGLYDAMGLEKYVREVLDECGGSNSFEELDHRLHIIATNLDTGNRAIFGRGERTDVPISLAVAASAALPLLYYPVRIGDDLFIDGGMRGTASLDLAIEHGAELVVCINPLVPYSEVGRAEPFFSLEAGGYLNKRGLQAVASQVSRINVHAGLHYHVKQIRKLHSNVDVILIEPKPDDCQMFYYNIMRYSARLMLAQHGFESVTVDLAADYAVMKETLARHGVPISRRLVIDELADIRESGNAPEVVRNVLEGRSRSGVSREGVAGELDRALAQLEGALDDLGAGNERMPRAA